ncbi:SpoIID/LytB domain-containing protein [Merismopedia glauca]|uniref:Sporulation protein n=2 Tax=Merismopedia TaxID=53402 RepID=A0A2T1C9E6_9CYAN|nr:sporulation protein [Merismopedia glauca CCAP 1448/3]
MLNRLSLLGLTLGWLWLMAIPSQAARLLRVAIAQRVTSIKVGTSTPGIVRDRTGRILGKIPPLDSSLGQLRGGKVVFKQWRGSQLLIEPEAGGYVWIGNGWYRGKVRLLATKSGLFAINNVDLEQYLYSVIGAEMHPHWPLEALKAQAVAARTYTLYKLKTSPSALFDMGNTVIWQVYKGLNTESLNTQEAVNATTSQIMTYSGKPILAVFHAAGGGHTENVENVWSNSLPYLRGVPDYDRDTPAYQWIKRFSPSQVSSRLGVSNVKRFISLRRSPYGRVLKMKVVGVGSSKYFTGVQLRERLGLRSTKFRVIPTDSGFTIEGNGFGHGLGLSQWGAYKLALQGSSYDRILRHYYRGVKIGQ